MRRSTSIPKTWLRKVILRTKFLALLSLDRHFGFEAPDRGREKTNNRRGRTKPGAYRSRGRIIGYGVLWTFGVSVNLGERASAARGKEMAFAIESLCRLGSSDSILFLFYHR